MKKYFLFLLLSIFTISCSKKEIIINGKINNPTPMSRIELIDIASVATLPITNIGISDKGDFSDTLKIEKEGIYAIVYQGKVNFIFLEKGNNINITGNGSNFPEDLKISGNGQKNNEFLIESQKFITSYLSKLDMTILMKNETDFIKELEKYTSEINKKLDEIAKSKKADNKVLDWKKNDLAVNLLMISNQYEMMHGQLTHKPDFKVSEKYKNAQKKLEKDSFIKEFPAYRQYILSKLEPEFSKFATPFLNDTKTTQTEVFIKFLDSKKEISQEQKDYLVAFIATQFDLHPNNEKLEQVMNALNEKVKTETIKKDLEKVYYAVSGLKIGTDTPNVPLTKTDGKNSSIEELKGKTTLLIFYSSWGGNMGMVANSLKEITEFYKSKINIAYINMDDDFKQFQKTSKSLFNGFAGNQYYAKGGLKSEIAKKFHIYGFKLPSFVILDNNGKIISKSILEVTNPILIDTLNKQTGLNAPMQKDNEEIESSNHNDEHNHKH